MSKLPCTESLNVEEQSVEGSQASEWPRQTPATYVVANIDTHKVFIFIFISCSVWNSALHLLLLLLWNTHRNEARCRSDLLIHTSWLAPPSSSCQVCGSSTWDSYSFSFLLVHIPFFWSFCFWFSMNLEVETIHVNTETRGDVPSEIRTIRFEWYGIECPGFSMKLFSPLCPCCSYRHEKYPPARPKRETPPLDGG